MFPMTITKKSGRHRSGTKDYHLVLIVNADGRAIVIHRWGRKQAWGTGWKLETYNSSVDAAVAYRKKHAEKLEREYSNVITDRTVEVKNLDELRKEMTHQYMEKIGKTITHLIPGLDVSTLKDPEPDTEFETVHDDEGNPYQRPKARAPRTLPIEPPKPEPIAERINSNPLWGVWG